MLHSSCLDAMAALADAYSMQHTMTGQSKASCVQPYKADRDIVLSSLPSWCQPSNIVQVFNPSLWNSYQKSKAKYTSRLGHPPQEVDLWHATDRNNVKSIVNHNFDWRLTERCRFGKGVCFTPDCDYADTYCNGNTGHRRALILTKVLVGKTSQNPASATTPPKKFDTTVAANGKVYVKYRDHEYYPAYVVYYHNDADEGYSNGQVCSYCTSTYDYDHDYN